MNNKYISRRHIIEQMEKRFKTIMIGGLSRFEKEFGYLWEGENGEPVTEKDIYFRDKWEDLRNDLLDHGNYQIRNGLEELEKYLNKVEKYNLQIFYNQKGDGK
jgi:hypothetical protein